MTADVSYDYYGERKRRANIVNGMGGKKHKRIPGTIVVR